MGFDDDSMGFSSKNGDSKGSYIYEVFIESKKKGICGTFLGSPGSTTPFGWYYAISWVFFIRIY